MPNDHRHRCRWGAGAVVLLAGLACATASAYRQEPATTVLADFEDASVAANVRDVANILLADCQVEQVNIPARGRGSLQLTLGATRPNAAATCALVFREPVRFQSAAQITTRCWINDGVFDIGFRVVDAADQVFETPLQRIDAPHRWQLITASLDPDTLERVRGTGKLQPPFEIQGYRVTTANLGKQVVFFDDLQVELDVAPPDLIRGRFAFDKPTRIYEPGGTVAALLSLENQSRRETLTLAVDLSWMRPDGSVLETQRASVRLQPSGEDFRSHRELDFSQKIREPGLYRLVAHVRAPDWPTPTTFESSVAVTPSNRAVARGRSTFFGIQTDLQNDAALDQQLEIEVAHAIGANLVALETPWARVQPRATEVVFNTLDPLVAAIGARDMAPLVVLTGVPEWAPVETDRRAASLAPVIEAMTKHYGGRLEYFQIAADVFDAATPAAAQIAAVQTLTQKLHAILPKITIFPPPIDVRDTAAAKSIGQLIAADPTLPLVFQTTGAYAGSAAALEAFRTAGDFQWQPAQRWLHIAEPLVGSGRYPDAEDVLRHFVRAAAAGLNGLCWFDLRDDDNDSRHATQLRGLIRRDFSPKTTLLGYAAAAGQLTGYRAAGAVAGAPTDFDTGLFIGTDRQVAVLLPRANRILPAVVTPTARINGTFAAQDFERRDRVVLQSTAPPLVPTLTRPIFVALKLRQPETTPVLELARPWLRVPHTVFCGPDTSFTIEIEAPVALNNSYVQLVVPRTAPFTSSFSAAALQLPRGEIATHAVELRPKDGATFERKELTLRLSIAGATLDVPLEVRPLYAIPAGTAAQLGALTTPGDARATATAQLIASHTADTLALTVTVEDDRVTDTHLRPDGTVGGDHLLIGYARENVGSHIEARLEIAGASAHLVPLRTTESTNVTKWNVQVESDGAQRRYRIEIPARALGDEPFHTGDLVRLAVEYRDDDADGFPPAPLRWGAAAAQSGTSEPFRWLRLTE